MNAFLYNLINSGIIWIILGIWIFICVAWVSKWKALFNRISTLLAFPDIFKTVDNGDRLQFYPRSLLHEMALGFRDSLKQVLANTIFALKNIVSKAQGTVNQKEYPFRTLGYLILLLAFGIFVLADAIAVAGTLSIIPGMLKAEKLGLLGRYEYAVFGGSLLTLILGFALWLELRSDKSEFTAWSERGINVRTLALAGSIIISLLSFTTLISWAIFRFVELNIIARNPILDLILYSVLYGIVPINSAIGAAIVFLDALRGIVVLLVLFGWFIICVLYIIDFIVTIIGSVVPFILDIAYRLLIITADFMLWAVTTPLLAILLPFQAISHMFSNNQEEKSVVNEKLEVLEG